MSDEIRFPIRPLPLTAGTVNAFTYLPPDRPHTGPGERGCPDCGGPAYDSGCDAPDCNGWSCPGCGTGCDADFADVGSQCAQAIAETADDEECE